MLVSILGPVDLCCAAGNTVHMLLLKLLITLYSSVKISSLILNSVEVNFVIGRMDAAII